MHAAHRADRPERLFRSEDTRREIDQRWRVVDDQIRRHRVEALRDEARRLGRRLLLGHRLEAAAHVVDREILFAHRDRPAARVRAQAAQKVVNEFCFIDLVSTALVFIRSGSINS